MEKRKAYTGRVASSLIFFDYCRPRVATIKVAPIPKPCGTDTFLRVEKTGSPVITDGEQTNELRNISSFGTQPGIRWSVIPFADGHTRQLPKLTAGPFRYGVHAVTYLKAAQRHAHRPVKQAVISASALSLLYPQSGIGGYSRETFLEDLVGEAERDIRECLEAGAACVQIDFTEGRLALRLDPSAGVLNAFIDLNNRVLDRFSLRTSADRSTQLPRGRP